MSGENDISFIKLLDPFISGNFMLLIRLEDFSSEFLNTGYKLIDMGWILNYYLGGFFYLKFKNLI